MDLVASLGRTLGFSLTSGVNLYATVAILGLATRYQWVTLPPQYQVFASDWVIGLALLLYAVEFIADKIPWVDSMWDSVHTFVRPVGGALVAVGTLSDDSSRMYELLMGLAGGTIAAGSHFTKASTRMAANTSPEPFSNWILSFFEDAFVLGLGLLALKYPLAAFVVTVLILLAIVLAFRWIIRKLRGLGRPVATT
ncbi:MAG TPA: DUF4126 domain-containing protein [Vicinamibacterales bacterium]|nr:DUF4126 domain-containing protein [Vicinamibacterales bacterium]